jgi:hypothetical protein
VEFKINNFTEAASTHFEEFPKAAAGVGYFLADFLIKFQVTFRSPLVWVLGFQENQRKLASFPTGVVVKNIFESGI